MSGAAAGVVVGTGRVSAVQLALSAVHGTVDVNSLSRWALDTKILIFTDSCHMTCYNEINESANGNVKIIYLNINNNQKITDYVSYIQNYKS